MALILINGTTCSIKEEYDLEFLRKLDNELSFKVQGAEFTPAFKRKTWDGIHRILTPRLTFPYGLLERVKNFYSAHSRPLDIQDLRPDKSAIDSLNILPRLKEIGKEPYPYQLDVLNVTKEKDSGIIRVATGGGKCVAKNSLILTEDGLLTFSELLENKILNPQEAIPFNIKVSTPLNNTQTDQTSMIYRDGYSESFRVKTNYGFEITATPSHKVKVLTNEGIVWKYVKDLSTSDYLVINKNTNLFGKKDNLSLDDAYWYGLLLGDGSYTTKWMCDLCNQDEHIINFAKKYIKNNKIGNLSVYKKENNKSLTLRIHNTKYRERLFSLGFKYDKSIKKSFPTFIRQLSKPLLARVIRGLYETDGWVEDRPAICIGLSSKEFIDQLQLILLNFGIVSSRRIKKTTHEDSHILSIYKEFIPIFLKEIGFDPNGWKDKRIKSVLNSFKNTKENSNTNLVFNQNEKLLRLKNILKILVGNLNKAFQKIDLKYHTFRSWAGNCNWRNPSKSSLIRYLRKIKKLLVNYYGCLKNEADKIINDLLEICSEKYFYNQVEKIETVISDNYDFVVPKTNSFIANGIINHNTLIAGLMTANFNKTTIIFVIGKDLLYQMHKLFSTIFTQEIGIIGDGHCEIRDINIASVWTVGEALGLEKTSILLDPEEKESKLDRNKYKDILDLLNIAKVVIYDECHLASCATIREIYSKTNPEHLYGMSASPYRDDNSDLLIEGIFGSKIVDISASYLIDNGFLVKPFINFLDVPKLDKKIDKKYPTVYKEYITDNPVRNQMVVSGANKLVNLGHPTLVLYSKINHGKKLFTEINKNIPSFLLSGKDSSDTREKAKADLESGKIKCIVASTIFDIGVDLPSLSGLIIASGGKSSVRACQRIGRVIRKYETDDFKKTCAVVIDFTDNAPYYLNQHSFVRYKIYSSEPAFQVNWPK